MPAQQEEVHAALIEGIELRELAAPLEVLGSAGKVTGVRCQRMVLGEPDADGRRQPVAVDGSVFDVPADVVLVAVGEAPDPVVPSIRHERRRGSVGRAVDQPNHAGHWSAGSLRRW